MFAEITDLSEYFEIEVEKLSGSPTLLPFDYENVPENGANSRHYRIRMCLPISYKQPDAEELTDKFTLSIIVFVNQTAETEESEPSSEEPSKPADLVPFVVKSFELTTKPEWMEESFESWINICLSNLITAPDAPGPLPISAILEEFYVALEEHNYPFKEVVERDYYYPVFDSRHWNRHAKLVSAKNSSGNGDGSTNVSYRARALYDFQALMQGELSFQENEVLQVLADLGNGWLTARKVVEKITISDSADDGGEERLVVVRSPTMDEPQQTGLIPENYIERMS